MEPVFLRLRRGDGTVATYPLSAFGHLEHSSRNHIFAVVGTYLWPLAGCRNGGECELVEDAILDLITRAVRAPLERSLCPAVLDLSRIAAEILLDLRAEEDWQPEDRSTEHPQDLVEEDL